MSCKTCQPMPYGLDDLDVYSLQEDVYIFVVDCPPGIDCRGLTVVYMVCCDGTVTQAVVPAGMYDTVVNALATECARKVPTCSGDGSGSPTYPPYRGGTLYGSDLQLATVACPGCVREFRWLLPAGQYLAFDEEAANEAAFAAASAAATAHAFCLNGLSPALYCLDTDYHEYISLSRNSHTNDYSWGVVAGSLPPGFTLAPRSGAIGVLSGRPTTAGTYTFTVRATATDGCSMDRQYTVEVTGITTASPLPDATENEAYSQTLAVAAGWTATAWTISDGALPAGLALNASTGEISGTPTDDGAFAFTISVVLQKGATETTCSKDFALTVAPAAPSGIDWTQLLWANQWLYADGNYTPVPLTDAFTPAAGLMDDDFTLSASVPSGGGAGDVQIMRWATLSYTGGATTCTVHLHFTKSVTTPPLAYKAQINFYEGMALSETWDLTGYPNGANEVTHVFTVHDTLGAAVDLHVQLDFELIENGTDECSFNISVGKVT